MRTERAGAAFRYREPLLIAETKAPALGAGLQVLGARGSELECSFAHGVVRQLFEPLLAALPEAERAALFAGAAGLAAPLFDPIQMTSEPAPDSSLATRTACTG